MRFPFRPIAIGLLIGAAIFFIPFQFPLLLFFIFFFLCWRFFFRPWRGDAYNWRYNYYHHHPENIPIDGNGQFNASNRNAPERNINVQ